MVYGSLERAGGLSRKLGIFQGHCVGDWRMLQELEHCAKFEGSVGYCWRLGTLRGAGGCAEDWGALQRADWPCARLVIGEYFGILRANSDTRLIRYKNIKLLHSKKYWRIHHHQLHKIIKYAKA